jgi:hypothetical protein
MLVTNDLEYNNAIEALMGDEGECSLIFEDRLKLALQAVRYEQSMPVPDSIVAMDALAECC